VLKNFPEIDYRNHPAFINLFDNYKYDNNKIDEIIDAIDNSFDNAIGLNDINKARKAFEEEITLHIHRLVDYVKVHIGSVVAFELFIITIEYTKDVLLKSLIRDSLKIKYKKKKCDSSELELLKDDGMYLSKVNAEIKYELQKNSREYYHRLKEKAVLKPHLRSYENIPRFSTLSKSISKLVKTSGILSVVSNYMQTDMQILGTGIEYSCSEHEWYKNSYSSIQGYSSAHEYLHIDEAPHFPKTLYYLNPVSKVENGATKFIKGSHTLKRSNFLTTFHKGLDRESVDRYFKIDDTYYRPMYKIVELRQILAKLPERLIGSSHLGDDIIEGTTISNELKENEATFINDGSDAIVFDGCNGLHKGANTTEGERLSLQIIYVPKNEYLVNRLSKDYSSSEKIKILLRKVRELCL
jgi:hypothetical protein